MADPRVAVRIAAVDEFSAVMARMRKELSQTGGVIRSLKLGDVDLGVGGAGGGKRAAAQASAFEQAANRARGAMRGLSGLGALPGLGALAGAGSVAGVFKMAGDFAQANVDLRNTARLAGTSASSLLSLRGAATLTGMATGTVDQAMTGLNRTLGEATYGRNTQAAALFQQWGIGFGNMTTGAKRSEEVLPALISKLQEIAKVDPRAALRAMDVLGLPADFLPLIVRGNEELARLRAESDRLRGSTGQNAEAADRYTLAQGKLTLASSGLRDELVTRMEPALSGVLTDLAKLVQGNKDVENSFLKMGISALDWVHQMGIETGAVDFASKIGLKGLLTRHGLRADLPDETPQERAGLRFSRQTFQSGETWNQGVYDRLSWAGKVMYRNLPGSRENYNRNTPAGPAQANGAAVNQQQSAHEAYDFWTGKGFSPAGAASMVAMEQGESGFNPGARGDGGSAHGLFQHHADRRARILAATGIDMSTASAADQREGLYQEMARGLDRQSGMVFNGIRTASNVGLGVAAGVNGVERPADRAGETAKRSAIAQDWLNRLGGAPRQAAAPAPEPEPESPDLSRGGRLPQLLAASAPAGRVPAEDNAGGSTVRIDINHTGVPEGVSMAASTDGPGAEIGNMNIRRAMPNAGAVPRHGF